MSSMFKEARSFNRPLYAWNISEIKNTTSMFENSVLFNQDISGWTTSKVTDMSSMFKGCLSLNQFFGKWDISNVIQDSMFEDCSVLNQSFYNWDLSLSEVDGEILTKHDRMFKGCLQLEYYYADGNVTNSTVKNAYALFKRIKSNII